MSQVNLLSPSLGRLELPVRIEGTGKYLPARVVTASEVDKLVGAPDGWTLKHTGVSERRFVTDETSAFLGAEALRAALNHTDGKVPDLLISAGGTPQQPIPCTAAFISKEMDWNGVTCFDINATCLGFLAALHIAVPLLASGRHQRIAIVCAEIASKGLNWAEPEAAALMGDGAAAVILSGALNDDGRPALIASALETWPEGANLTEIRGGGTFLPATLHEPGVNTADFQFHMDGPGVFRLASERMEAFVAAMIGNASDRWAAIDLVIPHQASPMALRHLRRRLGIPAEKLMEIGNDHGNIIAASLPMALHEAIRQDRLRRGQTALFLGTSAGFSLGAALLRY